MFASLRPWGGALDLGRDEDSWELRGPRRVYFFARLSRLQTTCHFKANLPISADLTLPGTLRRHQQMHRQRSLASYTDCSGIFGQADNVCCR